MAHRQLVLAVFPDEPAADSAAEALKKSDIADGDAIGVLVLGSLLVPGLVVGEDGFRTGGARGGGEDDDGSEGGEEGEDAGEGPIGVRGLGCGHV